MRVLLVCLLVVLAGCGGPPADKAPTGGQFTVTGPAQLDVLHGGKAKVPVELSWQREPAEEVELSAAIEPAGGLTARLEPVRLAPGKTTAQLEITVGETARPGEYTVTISGKAEVAGQSKARIRVKVPAKD